MQKTFGKKELEVTVGITHNWGRWGLPLAIDWWTHKLFDVSHIPHRAFNLDIALDILCVRIFIDIWRWKNERT